MMDAKKLLGLLAVGAVLAASLGAVETLSQRRRQLAEMSAEQREELFHNEQQFGDLTPQEQQRIRDLHEQIENAPDRELLRATMNRYCKWLETQPALYRDRLLADKKKSLKERIATVKEFLAMDVDDKSRRGLVAWLDQYIAEHGARLIENHGPGSRPGIAKLSPERQKVVLREKLLRQAAGPGQQMPISEPEMARLRAGLSPELRAKLEAKKPAEQARIIAHWLRETASHELEASHEFDEQLADFFEKTLSDKDRDRLMRLPSDEMYKSLSDQYSAYLKQSKSGERPLRPRGRRSGPPRGSGARRWLELRDEKETPAATESKGN